ncbi:MAG: M42 family metallopeptidase [Firmicutes bacterium]|nr:M42 family metallopeptidase [Bacillota bacterium]
MDTLDFLGRLSRATGLPGHESEVSRIVAEAFGPLAADVRIDRLGSCIAFKPGDGPGPRPKVMFAAHSDQIGLVVTKIEDGGFLRFAGMGGVDPRVLPGMEVLIHGRASIPGVVGSKPPHTVPPEERNAAFKMDELYVDAGLAEEQVRENVQVGDMVSFESAFSPLGDFVVGKSFDDRAGVAVLYECLDCLSRLRHSADVYIVATVQEETGMRGAACSTFCISPDVGIAIDVTHGDMPGIPEYLTSRLDKGPVLSAGPNVHPKVLARLDEVARRNGIPAQTEVSGGSSGTDAWAIQVTRSGVATGVISIPLRYMHTPVEVLSLRDIQEAGRLAAQFAADLDRAFVEGLRCY